MPVFVTEFWSGWFDHWGEKHHTVKIERIEKALRKILASGASFNFYMFHGNFLSFYFEISRYVAILNFE